MANCKTSDETSEPAVGIVLVLIACLCYSLGNCLQRYSLLRGPGELVFGCLNRNLGWMLGAFIYFSANGIYSLALSFAPVTLLSAVFSLTIVTNAACSVYFIGDSIPCIAYIGYFLVLLGAIVFAISFRAEVCHFDGDELISVMLGSPAIAYWVVSILLVAGGSFFAFRFEKKCPIVAKNDSTSEVDQQIQQPLARAESVEEDEKESKIEEAAIGNNENDDNPIIKDEMPSKSNLIARLIYPSTLGMIETIGLLLLKAINSLLTTTALDDEDEESKDTIADKDFPDDIGLWSTLIVFGGFTFIGIIIFLRLVYARFEITGAFPVEFGVLTFTSVVGGFAVFQDYKFIENSITWLYISLASVSITGGIGIVAYGSWQAKEHSS